MLIQWTWFLREANTSVFMCFLFFCFYLREIRIFVYVPLFFLFIFLFWWKYLWETYKMIFKLAPPFLYTTSFLSWIMQEDPCVLHPKSVKSCDRPLAYLTFQQPSQHSCSSNIVFFFFFFFYSMPGLKPV